MKHWKTETRQFIWYGQKVATTLVKVCNYFITPQSNTEHSNATVTTTYWTFMTEVGQKIGDLVLSSIPCIVKQRLHCVVSVVILLQCRVYWWYHSIAYQHPQRLETTNNKPLVNNTNNMTNDIRLLTNKLLRTIGPLQLDLAAQCAAAASQPAGWYRPTAYGPTDRPVAWGDSLQ